MKRAPILLFLAVGLVGCKTSSKAEVPEPASALPEGADAQADGCQAVHSDGGSIEDRFDAVVGDRRAAGGMVFLIKGDATRIDAAVSIIGMSPSRARSCPGALTLLFFSRMDEGLGRDFERALATSPGAPTDVLERHYVPWSGATPRAKRAVCNGVASDARSPLDRFDAILPELDDSSVVFVFRGQSQTVENVVGEHNLQQVTIVACAKDLLVVYVPSITPESVPTLERMFVESSAGTLQPLERHLLGVRRPPSPPKPHRSGKAPDE